MDREGMIDRALAMLGDDMDDMEGNSAMAHPMEECPDPVNCTMHDDELKSAMGQVEKSPAVVEISIKGGEPDGDEKAENGLSPEEAEALRGLLK